MTCSTGNLFSQQWNVLSQGLIIRHRIQRSASLRSPYLRGKGRKISEHIVIFIKEAKQSWEAGNEVNTTEYYFFLTYFSVLIQNILVYQDGWIGKNLTSFYSKLTLRKHQWRYFSLGTPSVKMSFYSTNSAFWLVIINCTHSQCFNHCGNHALRPHRSKMKTKCISIICILLERSGITVLSKHFLTTSNQGY